MKYTQNNYPDLHPPDPSRAPQLFFTGCRGASVHFSFFSKSTLEVCSFGGLGTLHFYVSKLKNFRGYHISILSLSMVVFVVCFGRITFLAEKIWGGVWQFFTFLIKEKFSLGEIDRNFFLKTNTKILPRLH
jgi:hypothetical protein